MDLEAIRKLSVEKRIQLVADIWDTIPPDADKLPLTEPQKAELDRRLALLQKDPQGRPWRDVLDRIERDDE